MVCGMCCSLERVLVTVLVMTCEVIIRPTDIRPNVTIHIMQSDIV